MGRNSCPDCFRLGRHLVHGLGHELEPHTRVVTRLLSWSSHMLMQQVCPVVAAKLSGHSCTRQAAVKRPCFCRQTCCQSCGTEVLGCKAALRAHPEQQFACYCQNTLRYALCCWWVTTIRQSRGQSCCTGPQSLPLKTFDTDARPMALLDS